MRIGDYSDLRPMLEEVVDATMALRLQAAVDLAELGFIRGTRQPTNGLGRRHQGDVGPAADAHVDWDVWRAGSTRTTSLASMRLLPTVSTPRATAFTMSSTGDWAKRRHGALGRDPRPDEFQGGPAVVVRGRCN